MRIGIFLCACRGVISNVIDVSELGRKFNDMEDIVFTKIYDAMCAGEERDDIIAEAKKNNLDGVVLAGCSPKQFESMSNISTFLKDIEGAGINSSKLGYANLKEQIALPYRSEVKNANSIADLEIKVALRKIKSTCNATFQEKIPDRSVIVIGSGPAGSSAALKLANQGFKVTVVEKKAAIGGPQLRHSKAFPKHDFSQCILTPLFVEVALHPNINVMTQAEVVDVSGRVGNYNVMIKQTPRFIDQKSCTACGACIKACPVSMENEYDYGLTTRKVIYMPFGEAFPRNYLIDPKKIDYCRNECKKPCINACPNGAIDLTEVSQDIEIETGGVIVAMGADIYRPTEFGYENTPDVLTLAEYGRILAPDGIYGGKILRPSDKKPPETIGFVGCVGSKDPEKHAYCSRYCCMALATAVKETHEKLPDSKIYVFYRDFYPVGKNGEQYIQSIIQMDKVETIRAIPVRRETSEGMILDARVGGESLAVPLDMLVLATAIVPNDQTENMRTTLDIDIDEDGFFRELNSMTANVNTTDEGMFICGSCSGPKTISESINEGAAAAASVAMVLGQDSLKHEIFVSMVDEDLCGGCGTCIKTCMFHASSMNKEKNVSQIDIMRCKGCGNCVTACPSGARDLLLYPNNYFKEAIETFSTYDPAGPKILALLCSGSSYECADQAGLSGFKYPANVVSIRVPCAGRVNVQHVLYAFEKGFDGVLIGDCHHGNCHFIVGNTDMERRINLFREVLRSRRIDDDRLRIESMSPNDGKKYADVVQKFVDDLIKMEA